jgi:hypothetical protein
MAGASGGRDRTRGRTDAKQGMAPLSDLGPAVAATLAAWERVGWDSLQFARLPGAMLLLGALAAVPLLVLLARALGARSRRRAQVVLPAVLANIPLSLLSPLRHTPILLFALGVPFFAIAVADPLGAAVREEVTYSGRQMAMVIDASGSMVMPFEAPQLQPVQQRAFYAAVTAAERFLQLRMKGQHADRVAVIQFGNEAYIVTPFTTDYENAVLSLRLIGEPRAWHQFNVFGTTIIQGLDQGLRLFETFDLLHGSDNMIVLVSDGNDGETMFRGRSLDQMMEQAREQRIPIFMVRLGWGKPLGDVTWDGLWKRAVERTGGRFFVADDESSLLSAVGEVDRLAEGRIIGRRSASASPVFGGFALMAVALWLAAGALELAVPWFRTFP